MLGNEIVVGVTFLRYGGETRWGFVNTGEEFSTGNDLAEEPTSRNPEGRGSSPHPGNRRTSLISTEHAESLRSTPLLVLCCAWLVTMSMHVHCGLDQLSLLPTSGDDDWVVASTADGQIKAE